MDVNHFDARKKPMNNATKWTFSFIIHIANSSGTINVRIFTYFDGTTIAQNLALTSKIEYLSNSWRAKKNNKLQKTILLRIA